MLPSGVLRYPVTFPLQAGPRAFHSEHPDQLFPQFVSSSVRNNNNIQHPFIQMNELQNTRHISKEVKERSQNIQHPSTYVKCKSQNIQHNSTQLTENIAYSLRRCILILAYPLPLIDSISKKIDPPKMKQYPSVIRQKRSFRR